MRCLRLCFATTCQPKISAPGPGPRRRSGRAPLLAQPIADALALFVLVEQSSIAMRSLARRCSAGHADVTRVRRDAPVDRMQARALRSVGDRRQGAVRGYRKARDVRSLVRRQVHWTTAVAAPLDRRRVAERDAADFAGGVARSLPARSSPCSIVRPSGPWTSHPAVAGEAQHESPDCAAGRGGDWASARRRRCACARRRRRGVVTARGPPARPAAPARVAATATVAGIGAAHMAACVATHTGTAISAAVSTM